MKTMGIVKSMKWLCEIARLVLPVTLLLFVATTAKCDEEKYKLTFKMTGKTDKIIVISKEKICTTPWSGKRYSTEIKSRKIIARKSFKTGDNEITTKFRTLKIKLSIDQKKVPSLEPLTETSVITDRHGNKLKTKDQVKEDFITDTTLVLPEKPVIIGEVWHSTIAPSKAYPASLKVKYKLTKVEYIGKKKCAVILATCTSDEVFKDRYAKTHLSIRNKIYFDLKRGKVIKNTSQTEFIITWLKEMKRLPMQRATFSTTSMTLSR